MTIAKLDRPVARRRARRRDASSSACSSGFKRQLPDADPQRDPGVDRRARRRGPSARAASAPTSCCARCSSAPASCSVGLPGPGPVALHQHHLARAGAAVPRRRGDGAAHPPHHPLERGGHGAARQPAATPGIGGHLSTYASAPASTRSASTTSSAARTTAARATRSSSRATPRPASTRARSSRAGSRESQLDHFRREVVRGAGPVVLSAPAADARLLGVPDRVDGPRADQRHLPGALQPLPARRAASRTPRARGCGRSSATARRTSPRRSAR